MAIEGGGLVVLGVDDRGMDGDLGPGGAEQGIGQERAAEALAAHRDVDRKTPDARGRHQGITRQLLGEFFGEIGQADRRSGQRVVTDDALAIGWRRRETNRNAPALVLPSLSREITIERVIAAREGRPIMPVVERADIERRGQAPLSNLALR